MKLKVNWGGQRRVVDLGERSINDVTLAELKQAVLTHFHSDNQELGLSLNKEDVFQGEDQTLSSFGLVSGDLVHVIGPLPPSNDVVTESSSMQSGSSSSSQIAYQTVNSHSSKQNESSQVPAIKGESSECLIDEATEEFVSPDSSFMESSDKEHVAREPDAPQVSPSCVNRYLSEPLVLRESSASQVPAVLSELYTCSDCGGNTDALWIAVHCLMLECGFSSQDVSIDCMPSDWRRKGYYRCEYIYHLSAGFTGHCSVTGVTLGNTLAVHGVFTSQNSFNTDTLHLSAAQFIRGLDSNVPAVYRSLDRLSLMVKDKICLPLANEISTSAGYREEQGLLALPNEVLLRIVCRLDFLSVVRLGQTCNELNAACTEKVVWRRLYLQRFAEPRDRSLGQDWKQLYKQAILNKKLREESERMQLHHMWHVFPHRRGTPPFPYMVGGNFDLHPRFVAGIPDNSLIQENHQRPDFVRGSRSGRRLPDLTGRDRLMQGFLPFGN